jgi:hypothetical protein
MTEQTIRKDPRSYLDGQDCTELFDVWEGMPMPLFADEQWTDDDARKFVRGLLACPGTPMEGDPGHSLSFTHDEFGLGFTVRYGIVNDPQTRRSHVEGVLGVRDEAYDRIGSVDMTADELLGAIGRWAVAPFDGSDIGGAYGFYGTRAEAECALDRAAVRNERYTRKLVHII